MRFFELARGKLKTKEGRRKKKNRKKINERKNG
jgi:hypothetical protein